MRHLYVRIYLTLLLVVFVCIVLAGFLARQVFDDNQGNREAMAPFVQLVADQLPSDTTTPADLQRAIEELSDRLRVDLSLWSAEGALLEWMAVLLMR